MTEQSHRHTKHPTPVDSTSEFTRTPTFIGVPVAPTHSRTSTELPPDTHPTWVKLIQNPMEHEFGYAAAGMLIFNLNLQWRRDPAKLRILVKQARDFFHKYQRLLASDIQKLFS